MFTTQFHITPEELCELVGKWMDDYPQLVVTAFAFPPEHQVPITRTTLRDVIGRPDVLTLAFTECPVDPTLRSGYAVFRAGLQSLTLHIGHLGSWGLSESTMSADTVTPLWKKLNAALKKQTTAGADVAWDDGTPGHHNRNRRFTAGAKALAASGIPLRQSHQSTNRYLPK